MAPVKNLLLSFLLGVIVGALVASFLPAFGYHQPVDPLKRQTPDIEISRELSHGETRAAVWQCYIGLTVCLRNRPVSGTFVEDYNQLPREYIEQFDGMDRGQCYSWFRGCLEDVPDESSL